MVKQQNQTKIGNDNIEAFEYMHPMGFLTIVLDHNDKELRMVSFTPVKDIKEVKSIDWYFKNGECTGWGTGQNGWKWHL